MIIFREKALVVWRSQVVPIMHRYVYPDGALYVLHTKNRENGLVIDSSVSFGQLVSEMNSYAHFCVGDKMDLGPWDRYVKARWWSFRRGTVIYRINDLLDERRVSPRMTQEELVMQVDAFATSRV
ncbi:MAG: hypothetical protein IT226_16730 [Flavobacteriales bacterium]|nr:hypothetical protein [Flavobacteriales bacterium]